MEIARSLADGARVGYAAESQNRSFQQTSSRTQPQLDASAAEMTIKAGFQNQSHQTSPSISVYLTCYGRRIATRGNLGRTRTLDRNRNAGECAPGALGAVGPAATQMPAKAIPKTGPDGSQNLATRRPRARLAAPAGRDRPAPHAATARRAAARPAHLGQPDRSGTADRRAVPDSFAAGQR